MDFIIVFGVNIIIDIKLLIVTYNYCYNNFLRGYVWLFKYEVTNNIDNWIINMNYNTII